ncbi:MAG: hydrogenase formation protein HypD [Actinobacteria bacterium HGW-Actinobacteria-10]|nr:MAG: hydrogenase formation protein HypD [Actinobacteria bacterium HGW-Actinobacteria-10]
MDLSGYRDPDIARGLIDALAAVDIPPVKFMEVCGTHTVAIARNGLRDVMPPSITLLSGPGCPVCVTANRDIDTAVEYARRPGTIVTTFGDMMKVPGSSSSLAREKADGHDVRIVYSPLDALDIAEKNPDSQVVFIGVGFETTVPVIGSTIKQAAARGLENFSVFSAHKTVPAALEALVNDPEVAVGGFILPGHVSVIIGTEPYRFLAEEYGVPSVITGFEPVDVLQGVLMLARQVAEGRAEVEVAYTRVVPPEGNPAAVAVIERVFEPVDAEWRGIGTIPGTGLAIREEFAYYDAMRRLPVTPPEPREIPGCQCGEVLRGVTLPYECRLFGGGCTPEHPIGPCMVSSEGSCAAYYRYTDYGKDR